MPDYAWICLNMMEYAWIFLIRAYLFQHVPIAKTWVLVSTKFIVWRNMSLFLEKRKFDFIRSGWKYLICFSKDLSYLFEGVLWQNERTYVVWAPKLGLGKKTIFDAFCYLLSSCSVLLLLHTIRVLLTFQAALWF